MDPLYLTTAIPFVNAAPHLGHALELVQTDAIARHARLRGRPVRFLTGTDENAPKNAQAAADAGVDVAAFVTRNAALFAGLAGRVAGLLRRLHPYQRRPPSRPCGRGDLACVPRRRRSVPSAVRGLVLLGLRAVRRPCVRRARRASRVGRGGELVLPPLTTRGGAAGAHPRGTARASCRTNGRTRYLRSSTPTFATSASRARVPGHATGASACPTTRTRSSTCGSTRS